mgnify:CR=1 FL=1
MSADGDWKVTVKSPMGSQDCVLSLSTQGNALSGKFAGPQGTQEFEGGSAEGNKLAWNIKVTQPMAMDIDFNAEVEGDNISGTMKLGAFGEASFAGNRA